MARIRLTIKNWTEFQHYKDRAPAWIKLHRGLLDNYDWHRLPDASKALAPMIWLLASEYEDGVIEADTAEMCFRLRISEQKFHEALKPLIEALFMLAEHDASGVLARAEPPAIPEEEKRRGREVEKEREKKDHSDAAKPVANRGTRLTDDWQMTPELRAFASDHGLEPDGLRDEFVDFWTSVPGSKGLKLDWAKTFKNRCRELGKKQRQPAANRESFEQRRMREVREALKDNP